MALPADFSNIYGSTATGGLTPISDVNYAKGWEFVGANPPTKNDFSYLQNLSDLKSQWLYSNKLQRTDPFGDIKADGAAAVAKALSNLGLGDATKAIIHTGKVIADLNAPPKNSTGFAYHNAQNSPGFNATVLTVDSIEGSYDIQIAIGYNPLKFAFRAYSGDAKVWLNWVVLGSAAARDTVGPVSQSGGAPAGAIIERGSNSNGEYTKYADGTLICWFTRSVESITSNPSGGTTNLYFSSEVGITFPATFVGTTPTVTPSSSLSSGGNSSWPSVRGRSLTGTSLTLISNVQNAAAYLGYTAIGRWF